MPVNFENAQQTGTTQVLLPNGESEEARVIHTNPYRAWTPWMSAGIAHSKTWAEAFITEYKRLQEGIFTSTGNVIKDPVRLLFDSESFPRAIEQTASKNFGLCLKDPRYGTEPIPGFNKTLKEIVEATATTPLNLSQEVTDVDGIGQWMSCASWEWRDDEAGHDGQIFIYNGSDFRGNYTLPTQASSGLYFGVGSGRWYKENQSVPQIGSARRYDLLTFSKWWGTIYFVAVEAALQEGIYDPFIEAFPGCLCSNYNSKDHTERLPEDQQGPPAGSSYPPISGV